MKALTYCSFADLPGCLGVVILEGELDPVQAARKAQHLGINPGGQLAAVSCTDADPDVPQHIFAAMAANVNRLISPEEARQLFEAKTVWEHRAEEDLLR